MTSKWSVWDAVGVLRRFFLRLLSIVRLNRAESELNREIKSHLQLLEDEHVAKGMSREDARFAARRAFGGVEQAKEQQRDARGFRWMANWRIDLRLGTRMLLKHPGLSLIGGAGLAIGTAIGAAFFAFFYSYIYATIPGPGGDRIVGLENWSIKTNNEVRQAAHDFAVWRDEMKTVQELGAFRTINRNMVAPGGAAEPIRIAEITAAGLNVARVAPRFGRSLIPADEDAGAAPVLVIGSDVWASRFNSDPSIIGRQVRIGDAAHTIVGVMPEGFEFPVNHSYWTPLHLEPSRYPRLQGPAIFIFGRLAPGVTIEQAQAELTTLASNASARFPDTHADVRARVMPYAHPIMDIQGVTSWQFAMMQFVVSLLLLIVAVNVAVLIYARTATRQGEIAVRTALGASRGRLVTQLFIEALVLCGVAAAAGLLLAKLGLSMGHSIMEAEVGRLPYFVKPGIPTAAYVYVALLTLVAAAIAGVLPALQATGRRMEMTLKEFGSRSGLRLGGTWTTLIVAQVALAVAGLPMAVAGFWGDIAGAQTRMAFDTNSYLAAFLVSEPDAEPDRAARLNKLRAEFAARLEAEPRVEAVTLASGLPGNQPSIKIEIDGAAEPRWVGSNHVAEDFFDAFETPLLSGRALTPADAIAPGAIVVNRAFAQRVLGGRDAVGARVRIIEDLEEDERRAEQPGDAIENAGPRPWQEVVGVVGDLYTNPMDSERVQPEIYRALDADAAAALLIKARGRDAAGISERVREIALSLDPTARLNVRPFADLERQAQLALRLMVLALSLVAFAVLMLSAAGIYALMAFTVSRRKKEIGIRAAMGADSTQLLRGIFMKAAMQLVAGVIVGVALSLLTDILAGGDGLGPMGRTVFVPMMAVIMVVVGLIASIGPARRSLKVQPTEALRAE